LNEFQVRGYRDSDTSRCKEIHDLARPIELKGSCDPRAFIPLAEDAKDLAEFQRAKKYVAEENKTILGFIGVDEGDIGWLYVDPKNARTGVGRALLRHAMLRINQDAADSLASVRDVSVYVLDGNTPALTLYRSEGFESADRFKSKNNGYPCTVLKLSNSF
jgi:ribosomal protein S18 acetylase RimI-like enzyme